MKSNGVAISRTATIALMVGLLSAPAYAGFDWTPPPAAPAVSASGNAGPAVPAMPADSVDKTELMPIPGTSESPVVPTEPAADEAANGAPQIARETTAVPVTKAVDELKPQPYAGPFAVSEGFGTDIPLALALGQIVPSEFAYSFASNVNPGLKISWDGGKPWNEVLDSALSVHNLRAEIIGSVVMVRTGAAEAAPVNPLATPISEERESSFIPHPPQDAATMTGPDVVAAEAAVKGEGTANNYPRRSARKSFFDSVFTPDEAKGNQAPRPPVDKTVEVINGVPEEEIAQASDVAEAASLAPAAPAATMPLPTDPVPLSVSSGTYANSQKISYADEMIRDSSSGILPERDVSQNVVTAPKGPVLDPFQVSLWQAESNRNLRDVLVEWAGKAGVEVIWDSGYDYKLPKSVSLQATFPEAVTKVFGLYGSAEPRPQGKLHPNLPKGPSVLLVENYP